MNKIFILQFLLIFTLADCSKKAISVTNSESATEPILDQPDPKAIYGEFCASCHGARMEMFVDRRWVNGKNFDGIYKSIAKGIVSSGMPAYGSTMSENELIALTNYILEGVEDRSASRYDSIRSGSSLGHESAGRWNHLFY